MTIDLYITIFIIGSTVTSLLTEAVKKWCENAGKKYSANVMALINAIVVGCGGTAIGYILMGVTWDVRNILCLILMGVAVWIASMVGYDKVIQLLKQLSDITPNEAEADKE